MVAVSTDVNFAATVIVVVVVDIVVDDIVVVAVGGFNTGSMGFIIFKEIFGVR